MSIYLKEGISSIKIEYNTYGDFEGQYTCEIEYVKAIGKSEYKKDKMVINLDPEYTRSILAISAEQIVKCAQINAENFKNNLLKIIDKGKTENGKTEK